MNHREFFCRIVQTARERIQCDKQRKQQKQESLHLNDFDKLIFKTKKGLKIIFSAPTFADCIPKGTRLNTFTLALENQW